MPIRAQTAIALTIVLASAAQAAAYSREDAAYVTSSTDRAVVSYVVCLAIALGPIAKGAPIAAPLEGAAQRCRTTAAKMPRSATEPSADDIQRMIAECGLRPGDAIAGAACE